MTNTTTSQALVGARVHVTNSFHQRDYGLGTVERIVKVDGGRCPCGRRFQVRVGTEQVWATCTEIEIV
jgi:hypothetical protein